MSIDATPIKFAAAAKRFFGLKDGQSLLQFAQELKGLTQKDKEELAPLLAEALGCPVELA